MRGGEGTCVWWSVQWDTPTNRPPRPTAHSPCQAAAPAAGCEASRHSRPVTGRAPASLDLVLLPPLAMVHWHRPFTPTCCHFSSPTLLPLPYLPTHRSSLPLPPWFQAAWPGPQNTARTSPVRPAPHRASQGIAGARPGQLLRCPVVLAT